MHSITTIHQIITEVVLYEQSDRHLDALLWGEVDTLIMASSYQPDPGWKCADCRTLGTGVPETPVCRHCGKSSVRSMDIREALLRLASQQERPVEVVDRSDALMSLGGVGCLLRTHPDGNIDTPTATAAASG